MNGSVRPTRIEVDLDAIRHNVRLVRQLTETEVCAVVKADGYGHGAVAVARAATEAGAAWLAVALVEEGEELRAAGIEAPILMLSEPRPGSAARLLAAGLTPTGYSLGFLDELARAARHRGSRVAVQVKLDTGMARVGAPPSAWPVLLDRLVELEGQLEVEALWTHLACADELTVDTTRRQLQAFEEFRVRAAAVGIDPDLVHAANSAGALAHPQARYDLVRLGIGMYGLSPGADIDAADHGLRPALRLVSQVSFVKRVPAQTPVSYGHTWTSPTEGVVVTVPLGYADGVPRALSNRFDVLIGGVRCRQVGNVTMDQMLVWCADATVAVGDEVVLFGTQGRAHVRIEEWASTLATITYEIVSQLGPRVPRVHRNVSPAPS